jgi:enoyl-CoA hydratase
MASRVAGEREGVVVREAIALAVEIAGKSQIAVQAQKEAVNAGTSYCGPVFF